MTMTTTNHAAEAMTYIGKTGLLTINNKDPHQGPLRIPVRVVDAKWAYGHIRIDVVPLEGNGKWCVDVSRVDFSS